MKSLVRQRRKFDNTCKKRQTVELNSEHHYKTYIDSIVNKNATRYNSHEEINYCAWWGFINKN